MLDEYLEKLYFDKRMVPRGLSQGIISQKKWSSICPVLEDSSDKADIVQRPAAQEEKQN